MILCIVLDGLVIGRSEFPVSKPSILGGVAKLMRPPFNIVAAISRIFYAAGPRGPHVWRVWRKTLDAKLYLECRDDR